MPRLGAPTIGGTTTTQLPRLTCASWMVARSFASRRSAYHLTASRVIRADGSKRIGNQRTNSSRRALLATRREQQVRRPGNELIGDISDGAGSYRPAPLNFHPFLAAVTIASRQFPVLWKTAVYLSRRGYLVCALAPSGSRRTSASGRASPFWSKGAEVRNRRRAAPFAGAAKWRELPTLAVRNTRRDRVNLVESRPRINRAAEHRRCSF